MSYSFFGLALVLAVLDWIAVAGGWKKLEYFTKPATMVALLAFMVQNGGLSGGMLWFTLGLAFSLAGDVFLMLPRDRFIAGLVAFCWHTWLTLSASGRTSRASRLCC